MRDKFQNTFFYIFSLQNVYIALEIEHINSMLYFFALISGAESDSAYFRAQAINKNRIRIRHPWESGVFGLALPCIKGAFKA